MVEELKDIIQAYPVNVPVEVAAEYLHIGADSLRAAIHQGRCPFGFGWTSESGERRGFKIPTITFVSWLTKGTIMLT